MHPAYFQHQWELYKRRKVLFAFSVPTGLLLCAAGGVLSELTHRPWVFVTVAAIGILLPAIAAHYVWIFPCPKCEKPFASGSFWRNPFGTKCLHCGIPVGHGA